MRIVLDSNILVRANPLVTPESLARELLLTLTSASTHTLILSAAILNEVRRVLTYPHVSKRWPLSDQSIAKYLSALEAAASMVELPASSPAVVSDPDDDPILQTAVLGHADILCTRDEAFVHPAVQDYCRNHGIRVVPDINLMHELRHAKR